MEMKSSGANKLRPYRLLLAAFFLSTLLPAPAVAKKSVSKPQVHTTASAISRAKDKYGFPTAQITYFLNAQDATDIQALLKSTPRRPGDEDRRLMLEGTVKCIDHNNFEGALPIFSKVKHPEEASNGELYFAAKAFALAQDFKQAVALASIGVRRDNDQKCLEIRAASYSNMNRFDEAIQDFETLARTMPDWAADYLAKEANLLIRTNKYPQALVVAERAQRARPLDCAPPCNIGLCLEKLGRYREAVQAFTQAIENAKRQMQAKREATFFLTNSLRERQKCYQALGKLREAEADKAELARYSDKIMDELVGK
jgi:tetratricopeptide (TPR) repeat protein